MKNIKLTREIWFDMDGTIADLYGVNGWLEYLINEDTKPYDCAKVLVNMSVLARLLNRLQKQGYTINIISWLSKNGSKEYNEKVIESKKNWLSKHLHSVQFDTIHIVEHGSCKWNYATDKNAILFDDEERNRNDWQGIAYDVNNIIEVLKALPY